MSEATVRTRRWTRREYGRLIDLGVLHEDDPTELLSLVVEVADASLPLDRGLKARIYARAGLADYWIVNLIDRLVEVHRDPVSAGRRRSHYRAITTAAADEHLVPLAVPFSSILVADLLP